MRVPSCLTHGLPAAPGPGPEPGPEPGSSAIPDGDQAFVRLLGPGTPGDGASAGAGPARVDGRSPGGGPGPLRNGSPDKAGLSGELVDVLTRLRRDERRLESSVRRALAGQDFELPQLVALQSLAFKYSQRVELLGKLVDRLTSAVKQTLQMQI